MLAFGILIVSTTLILALLVEGENEPTPIKSNDILAPSIKTPSPSKIINNQHSYPEKKRSDSGGDVNSVKNHTSQSSLFNETEKSRNKMSSGQFRIVDEKEDLYQHFKQIYENEPFKFKVINDGADIIRARIHPKGDLIISHTAAEELTQMMFDKDAYLETASSDMNALNNNDEKASQNIDFITNIIFPLSSQYNLNIYNFSCSESKCILLASYLDRKEALEFVRAAEMQERYVVTWSYPIRDTNTESIYLVFR